MACKPVESRALLLALINFLVLVNCINSNTGTKQINSELKFGDRILPRNKQIEERSFNTNNNYNNNLVNNSINSNINNNNNINKNNNQFSEFNIFNYNSVLNSITTNPTVTPPSLTTAALQSRTFQSRSFNLNYHNPLSSVTTIRNHRNNNNNNNYYDYLKNSSAISSVHNSGISSRNSNSNIESSLSETSSENIIVTGPERHDSKRTNSELINEQNDEKIQAHRLEMSTEFFIVPSSSSTSPKSLSTFGSSSRSLFTRSTTIRPGGMILAAKTTTSPKANTTNLIFPNLNNPHNQYYHSGLRKEPWVIPVLVMSALSMFLMVAFEVFVLFKAWRTSPSRRHLFLGQMLLLGLFACSGLAAILTVTPTVISCGTIRFGAGVAFALVFASLLVKCVFLISLNGGVYLPAPYQALLLLFAVLIQIAVGSQWLITSPPGVENVSVSMSENSIISSRYSLVYTATDVTILNPTIPLCKTPFTEFLLSQIYVVFLILFVSVLAIKSRRIRDNYREATYIGLSIGGVIPIWIGWTLCGLVIADRHRDACIAFGLVATSATVFLVMFMPKGRQLAAMGKEGFYVEDREEHFSSLSRTGSGYSPSFFHFKPIKYGVMGNMGTTQTTNTNILNCHDTSTIKNSSNPANVATLGGDHVTLIAVPPSYTRMYHYYPAHLTQPVCYYTPPPPQPSTWYPGLFIRPSDDTNVYTTLEPTMSSNPNVYFQRGIHPGMMY